jgi:ribosomal-protein-alanine N-acetyltransferase
MDTLETARLRLRPFSMDDVEDYYLGISSDADVMRYLPGGKPRQRSDAQWVVSYFMRHAEMHGFGIWAVEEKTSDRLIGHAGLEFIPGSEEVEVAYTLAKAYWGQGYATEAAAEAIKYGFEAVNLPEIYGLAFLPNIASQNVMRKIGMESLGTTDRYYGEVLAYFRLTRDQYFAAQAGVAARDQ